MNHPDFSKEATIKMPLESHDILTDASLIGGEVHLQPVQIDLTKYHSMLIENSSWLSPRLWVSNGRRL